MVRLFGLSPTLGEIHNLVQAADESGDGALSFLEFVNLMGREIKTEIKPNPFLVLDQLRLQIREFREVKGGGGVLLRGFFILLSLLPYMDT